MEIKFFKPNLEFVEKMQTLVKEEVDNGIILLRTANEMATTIRSYTAVSIDGVLAGFVALHIHTTTLAEVRSLVVSKNHRGIGLGKKLILACINESREYGIKELLSLTYQRKIFEDMGFKEISKESIPEQKIWADCIRCKHFPVCDEIALIYKIEG